MKILRLLEMLNEFDRLGFAGRPDASGIRGHGMDRDPYSRSKDFPYDRDISYGAPAAYDRGSIGGSGPLRRPLTPKDDENFSLNLLDLEEIVREIMGSPILLSRGGSSELGSSVPGSSGGWAHNPPREWERGEMDEDPLNIDTRPPDIEHIPVADPMYSHDQTDDDLENRLDRIWGREDNTNFVDPKMFGNPNFHVLAPDPFSVMNTRLSSRGLYGLMPKESAWDRVSSFGNGRSSWK